MNKPNYMKRSFFQAAVVSILLYGCTTWTLTKRLERKLDGNYTRMLRAILNKSWRQHATRHLLNGHLPPITKTIQVRRTRHAGNCWRSRDELINDVLLWTPTYGRAKAGRPARTYIQQLCEDTGCSPEDLPEAINDREKLRERSGISVLAVRHDDDDDDEIVLVKNYDMRAFYCYGHKNTKTTRETCSDMFLYINNQRKFLFVFFCCFFFCYIIIFTQPLRSSMM